MPPEIRFLFRFRDLVASTISSHKQVIEEKGSCWWGWWKRPSEDNRSEVWDELSNATPENPITIGLFDSGNGIAFVAVVSEVIPPNDHAELVGSPDDSDHVPAYYRDSPFSRAWMRLKSIEPIDEFFHRFSFDTPSEVPNYPPQVLNQFAGKKIVDASELRGMDTTIWVVRPSRHDDRSDEILLTVNALSEPISGEVVHCRYVRTLGTLPVISLIWGGGSFHDERRTRHSTQA